MHRRALVSGLLGTATLIATARRAGAWSLITNEEFERDRAAPHLEETLAAPQPGAPIIVVEQPDETKPIKPPVTIRISFHPQQNASIDVKSFRATYGWLDITQRIVEHAQVTPSGLAVSNADIPAGHYRVTLKIADNMHRVGMRTFEFTIV